MSRSIHGKAAAVGPQKAGVPGRVPGRVPACIRDTGAPVRRTVPVQVQELIDEGTEIAVVGQAVLVAVDRVIAAGADIAGVRYPVVVTIEVVVPKLTKVACVGHAVQVGVIAIVSAGADIAIVGNAI